MSHLTSALWWQTLPLISFVLTPQLLHLSQSSSSSFHDVGIIIGTKKKNLVKSRIKWMKTVLALLMFPLHWGLKMQRKQENQVSKASHHTLHLHTEPRLDFSGIFDLLTRVTDRWEAHRLWWGDSSHYKGVAFNQQEEVRTLKEGLVGSFDSRSENEGKTTRKRSAMVEFKWTELNQISLFLILVLHFRGKDV